jgi:hypothetical protein
MLPRDAGELSRSDRGGKLEICRVSPLRPSGPPPPHRGGGSARLGSPPDPPRSVRTLHLLEATACRADRVGQGRPCGRLLRGGGPEQPGQPCDRLAAGCKEWLPSGKGRSRASLSHGERVGERGYDVSRSAGRASNLVIPLPPTASRRAPPSPAGRGVSIPVHSWAFSLSNPSKLNAFHPPAHERRENRSIAPKTAPILLLAPSRGRA